LVYQVNRVLVEPKGQREPLVQLVKLVLRV